MRINYYNAVISNTEDLAEGSIQSHLLLIPPPKEGCLNKLYRILLTSKPEPYHYDFITQCEPELARKSVIIQIKQRFGYSRKNTRTTAKTHFGSSPCLKLLLYSSSNSSKNKLIHPELEKLSSKISISKRVKFSLTTPKGSHNKASNYDDNSIL